MSIGTKLATESAICAELILPENQISMKLTLESIAYEIHDGYPKLRLRINGRDALVFEPKHLDQGIVILIDPTPDGFWHDNLAVTLPADQSIAREETILRGATTNPTIVAAVLQWCEASDRDDYRPGPVPLPAAQ